MRGWNITQCVVKIADVVIGRTVREEHEQQKKLIDRTDRIIFFGPATSCLNSNGYDQDRCAELYPKTANAILYFRSRIIYTTDM